MLDAERIAREVLADPLLPKAFKRGGEGHSPDRGPDQQQQLLALWHNRRRSILTSRQHLVNEAEHLLCELSSELGEQLPSSKAVRPRLHALTRLDEPRYDAPTRLRLQLPKQYSVRIEALDVEERQVVCQLDALVNASGSTLGELCGLGTKSVAELLVETGDPRRFTQGGFARFNGTAPCQPRPRRDPVNRSATATTPAGTAGSTRCCTGWRSPSCAANLAPKRSTSRRASTITPRRRPGASSNATSQTSSTAA